MFTHAHTYTYYSKRRNSLLRAHELQSQCCRSSGEEYLRNQEASPSHLGPFGGNGVGPMVGSCKSGSHQWVKECVVKTDFPGGPASSYGVTEVNKLRFWPPYSSSPSKWAAQMYDWSLTSKPPALPSASWVTGDSQKRWINRVLLELLIETVEKWEN